jgi:ATP-dependent exoDNAse (exonuclease V) beta subunit
MSREVADARQRSRALDPRTSFIVQAPAGSGKTELLIQRFLALLALVERPEEIAAITFTIKAAAEMRRRVFEALAQARTQPRPAEAHAARTWDLALAALARNDACGWGLEENAARLRIQTIDALCASLTRQMPVVSRFGAQPETIEDASELYAEAARNTLALVEREKEPIADDVARLLEHVDNHAVQAQDLLATMLAQRDHWLRTLGGVENRAALEAALAHVRHAAVARADAAFPRLPGAKPLPARDDVGAWEALAGALLTKEGQWRKKGVDPALSASEPLREALDALRALPTARYDEGQWQMLAAIMRVLHRAAAELKMVFAAHGKADFVEVAQAALRALHGEDGPTDLLLALDYRIRHLLVDEFQDTSFTQYELLQHLTSGWMPDDGRTLFVVGDPMQSIYRFREAEVALFLEARHEGIGAVALEPLSLSANFRSQAGIVDWVNGAFAGVMPQVEDVESGAVPYSPSDAVHDAEPEAVAVHAFADGDAEGEARRVVEIVRASSQGTTGILVRNRDHLAAIVPRLKASGLAFRAIEIEPLAHRPVVQDLLSLARALGHLADRTAWLALLRAPWAGLTLADLTALAGGDEDLTLWELMADATVLASLSADGRARLERTRDSLAPFVEGRGRASLRDAVEGAWLALGGPACVESDTDLEDAEIFLAHLEAAEDAGTLPDLAAFERGLARLFALPDLAAPETLQVMTIHRAKGLEFDTVIVPGLGAGTGRDDRRLFMWMETTAGLLLAPMGAADGEPDKTYEFIRALDKRKADHECGRLLYVAATRARKRLHLLGECRRDEQGAPKNPPKGSLLAKLWPAVCDAFAAQPAEPGRAAAGASLVDDFALLVRLAEPIAAGPPAPVPWQAPADVAPLRDSIEFSWVGETTRHVGSVVHRWLQRMAEDELRGWTAERVAGLRPAIRVQLASRGIAAEELDPAAGRTVAALAGAIDDPRGRWLLGPQRDARNEYRLSALIAGERRQLVIDRMFVEQGGRSWIVDYKTSTHEGADVEAFLASEQERYRAQLERYGEALALPGGHRLGLYFPLLKGWREWARGAAA